MGMSKENVIKLVVVLFGTAFIIGPTRNLIRALPTHTWPSVKGSILSSEIHERYEFGPKRPNKHRYIVRASYAYNVNGDNLVSDQISFGSQPSNFSSAGEAQSFLSRLRQGTIVDVYYNPSSPQHAV